MTMEISSQQEIERFLAVNPNSKDSGFGYGKGAGYGNDKGLGKGKGHGEGAGYDNGHGKGAALSVGNIVGKGAGFGNGEGAGFGNGEGYGAGKDYAISSYNGYRAYIIDWLPTLIYQIRDNYAKGAILNSDLTLTPCFIARVDNCFAHGETLHDAVRDARKKALNHTPVETRIQRFVQEYPDPDKPAPFAELFDWHNILTGSCLFGRNQFVEQHQLDTNAEYSPRFFIELTKDDFGGKIIQQLAEAYKISSNN